MDGGKGGDSVKGREGRRKSKRDRWREREREGWVER